jgi:hypothetical protein
MKDEGVEKTEEVKKLIRPGRAVRVDYGEGHRANRLLHIRAIVDEEQVVYRRWNRKLGWIYRVDEWGWFEVLAEEGRLKGK